MVVAADVWFCLFIGTGEFIEIGEFTEIDDNDGIVRCDIKYASPIR